MIKEEPTCDGKCDKNDCACPQTIEELVVYSGNAGQDIVLLKQLIEHGKRISNNYIRKALDKSYMGDVVMETSLTPEDIK